MVGLEDYYVLDLEVYPNYFLAGILKDGVKIKYEVITTPEKKVNQLHDLEAFMSTKNKVFIGYNVLDYDAQVLEKIFDYLEEGVDVTNEVIYQISQEVINSGRPSKWEYQLRHKWIDLMKVNHWDIKSAKKASLKWLEFTTNQDILDLPYRFDTQLSIEQIKEVCDYCLNSDLEATEKIYELTKPQLEIRKKIGSEEKLNLINSSEPNMARKLFLRHLNSEMNIPEKEIKLLKTDDIPFKGEKVIFNYVSFKEPIFNKILKDLQQLHISEDSKFTKKFKWKGIDITVGLGGLHGVGKPRIWEKSDTHIIMSSDVKSYYPNLCIRNKKFPRHLGKSFFKLYEGYYDKRISIPKSNPANYILKILLNSSYGMFLDNRSFLFDRELGMTITLNGQLLLLMLMENLSEIGVHVIQCNTDGIECQVPVDKIEEYMIICKNWETVTKLELEHTTYKKLVSWDINNYIAVEENGKSKCKGRFEFEPLLKMDTNALHKNRSQLIVPMAIHNYFVNGIPIEETILKHDNIFDFCIGERCSYDAHFESWNVNNLSNVEEMINKQKLPKTIRYYISNNGSTFKKIYNDGRSQFCIVHPQKGKSYYQTLFNKIVKKPIAEYDINYSYYLKEARKEIDVFQENQMVLI